MLLARLFRTCYIEFKSCLFFPSRSRLIIRSWFYVKKKKYPLFYIMLLSLNVNERSSYSGKPKRWVWRGVEKLFWFVSLIFWRALCCTYESILRLILTTTLWCSLWCQLVSGQGQTVSFIAVKIWPCVLGQRSNHCTVAPLSSLDLPGSPHHRWGIKG